MSSGTESTPTLYVNIDGVVNNFVDKFLNYFELNIEWPKGVYDIKKVTGHSMDELDPAFWKSFRLYPEAALLFEFAKVYPTCFISKVHSDFEAIAKFCLITQSTDYYGFFMPVLTCKGDRLDTSSILLDDSEEEIQKWPGTGILIPRPWNHGEGNAFGIVTDTLLRLMQ